MTAKASYVALALAIVGVSCTSPAPPPADPVASAPAVRSMAPADNVTWYQDCWTHFNNKAWAEFRQCYADSATSMQLGYGEAEVKGGDAIVASSQEFAKMAPDGHGTPQLILAHGPHVAAIYVLGGTNSGPMMGPEGTEMPATNKSFSQLFGHMIEIGPDGRVAKEIGVQDSATMLNHLGLSKEPARPPVPAPTGPPTIVIASGSETEAANVAAIRASFDAFNSHDIKAVAALTAPDLVLHEIAMPADMNMKENRQSMLELWKGFPDARVTPDTVWAAGDYVVATAMLTGTNTGDFAPMQARKTGRSVSVPALEIDRMADGKIVESWLFYDGMQFAQQVMGPPSP